MQQVSDENPENTQVMVELPPTSLRQSLRAQIFHGIIVRRDVSALQEVIEHGWNPNKKYDILHVAQRATYPHRNGIEVHLTSIFHLATRYGWKEGIELLLSENADPNTTDFQQQNSGETEHFTPLMRAIEEFGNNNIDLEFITFLISNGANVHYICKHSHHCAASLAVCKVNRPIANFLIKQYNIDVCAPVQALGPLLYAAFENCIKPPSTISTLRLAMYIAAGGVEENHREPPASVCEEAVELFKDLINHALKTNRNCNKESFLILLMRHGTFVPALLDFLYEKGADLDGHFPLNNILTKACSNLQCDQNNIRWLIRHGVCTDIEQNSFIYRTTGFSMCVRGSLFNMCVHSRQYKTAKMLLLAGSFHFIEDAKLAVRQLQMENSNAIRNVRSVKVTGIRFTGTQPMTDDLVETMAILQDIKKNQADDLREFSNQSLHFYPNDVGLQGTADSIKNQADESHTDHLEQVVDMLSHALSLRLLSRRCLRHNLLSLSPTVIKTLPVPPIIKRFILCHEL